MGAAHRLRQRVDPAIAHRGGLPPGRLQAVGMPSNFEALGCGAPHTESQHETANGNAFGRRRSASAVVRPKSGSAETREREIRFRDIRMHSSEER